MSNYIHARIIRGYKEIERLHELIWTDEDLINNVYICGGYVRYMCSPKERPVLPNDIDIYSRDSETYDKLVKRIRGADNLFGETNYAGVTLYTGYKNMHLFGCPTINLIRPDSTDFFKTSGDMVDILNNFDFTIVKCGLIDEEHALVHKDFLEHEFHQQLVIDHISHPLKQIARINKYVKAGYGIHPEEIYKVFLDWDGRGNEFKESLLKQEDETPDNDEGSYGFFRGFRRRN